jgi:hypothetical protein
LGGADVDDDGFDLLLCPLEKAVVRVDDRGGDEGCDGRGSPPQKSARSSSSEPSGLIVASAVVSLERIEQLLHALLALLRVVRGGHENGLCYGVPYRHFACL